MVIMHTDEDQACPRHAPLAVPLKASPRKHHQSTMCAVNNPYTSAAAMWYMVAQEQVANQNAETKSLSSILSELESF